MKHPQIKYMLMVELLCAVALLGIVSTCFFMTINHMNKAERNFIRENRAILVLDNSLERINALKNATTENIKTIFDDEYQKSSLNGNKKISLFCEIRKNTIQLSFKDNRNRIIAQVNLKK
jgi:hypothetical protein